MIDDTRLCQGVIRQAVKDLVKGDLTDYKSAVNYVRSAIFSVDCEKAGYPEVLRDSIKQMVLISKAQRRIYYRNITKIMGKK